MDHEVEDPVVVPHTQLGADTLRGVVEAFIGREGTDYGEHEKTLDQKVADVMAQLEGGEAQLVFDRKSETITIVRRG